MHRRFSPRTLAAVVIAVSSLIATSCYAPDISRLLYRCQGSDPCPSGMVCNFGLCVASDIAACRTGIGVWLTTDDYKALCPAIGPATFNSCSDNYEIDKNCPEEASTACLDPITMKVNPDCFRCCRKK